MLKLRVGTFNLFQFVEPPYSWYIKKDSFKAKQWSQKTAWVKEQITKMSCDIIGFQEVFSANALKKLTKELGFNYFATVDSAKVDSKNPTVFITTTVALASKYPILELQEVQANKKCIEALNCQKDFKFSRTPLKATIKLLNNKKIALYVNHFKSNRLNEFEYVFNKNHTLEQKINTTKELLKKSPCRALKQRLCETSSVFFDIKKTTLPIVFLCDLNDKEFSLCFEALTNEAYHALTKNNSYLLYDAYYLYDKKENNPNFENKDKQREATSYFKGHKNVLDYILLSKEFTQKANNSAGKVCSYELFNSHLLKNTDGSILESDHAQVVCEIVIA